MDSFQIFLCIVGFVVIVYLYRCYVNVIKNRNGLLEAKSGIDVQFKKRYDLLPNLVRIASGYMEHEKAIFNRITELRAQAMAAAKGSNESIELNTKLDGVLNEFKLSVENYPNLKANETMLQLMRTFSEVEEHIAAARRFYNSALTQLNNSVMIFPSNIFRNCAKDVLNSQYYECEELEREVIRVKDYAK